MSARRCLVTGLALTGLLMAGCGDGGSSPVDGSVTTTAVSAPGNPSPPLDVGITEAVPYTSERTVDVLAPTEGTDWPVVVYFHGGLEPEGYGTAEDVLLTGVAEQGVVVYAVRWASEGPAGGSEDSVCAMAFAADTAEEYGGDPNRITLAGYSAGGFDAVVHAFIADDPPLPVTDCVVDPAAELPQAVVSGGGPFFVADAARAGLLPAAAWTSLTPAQIDAFDPYLLIGQNPDLRVWMWVGEDDVGGQPDRPLPIAESNREYAAALDAAGYDVVLVEVPGGHEVETTQVDDFIETIVAAVG